MKKRDKPKKLTGPMLSMLSNASMGIDLGAGLHGRSAHGGATATEWALRRRGLLDAKGITTDGYAALIEAKNKSANVKFSGERSDSAGM